jgi:hypothetical protein
VLIYDPVQKAVAAVHAGWRGTVAGIIQNTVNKLIETYRCNPRHLIAAIGPSVSPEVYQVGSEVIQHVTNYYRTTEGLVSQINHEGKGFLNLWEAGKRQLLQAGLLSENIEISRVCTYKNNNRYYSARRESVTSGRFACGIRLNSLSS